MGEYNIFNFISIISRQIKSDWIKFRGINNLIGHYNGEMKARTFWASTVYGNEYKKYVDENRLGI